MAEGRGDGSRPGGQSAKHARIGNSAAFNQQIWGVAGTANLICTTDRSMWVLCAMRVKAWLRLGGAGGEARV